MKLTLSALRLLCPALPSDVTTVRDLFDMAGIEVEEIYQDGSDTAVEVELLANRGDHRGYLGVAREIAARLDGVVVPPPVKDLPEADDVRAHDFCDEVIAFATLAVDLDPHCVEATVELGNDIGSELGQPLHVFDADKVVGRLGVRLSRAGEQVDLLGHEDATTLPDGVLVVVDEAGVVAIAGVLGSKHASPTPGSRRIMVESACYDPVAVRVSGQLTGLSTVASQRFERGGDCAQVVPALRRFAALAQSKSLGKPDDSVIVARRDSRPLTVIDATAAECGRLLGANVDEDDFERRLRAYGFELTADGGWIVPAARLWDVERPADLYEEYAKSVGYDNLPESMPTVMRGAKPTPLQRGAGTAAEVLHGAGFFEVVTDGTYGHSGFEMLRQHLPADSSLVEHVKTVNAQESANALLKNNALYHALEAVVFNQRNANGDVKVYEFTRLFTRAEKAENGVIETGVLWAMAAGRRDGRGWAQENVEFDVFDMIGVAENIWGALGANVRSTPLDAEHAYFPLLHPYQAARLEVDGEPVGVIGTVRPTVSASFGATGSPVFMELSANALCPATRLAPQISPKPPIVRMLDFVLPREVVSAEVLDVIRDRAASWLREAWVSDVFTANLEHGRRSVTYTLEFEPENDRRANEINELLKQIVSAVEEKFSGVRLR